MERVLLFILLGYLSGSILYERVWSRLLHKNLILEQSGDHNPGTANAFLYGGFLCGILTLAGDLLKGFLPVWLFLRYGAEATGDYALHSPWMALILAAPVAGHNFPVFFRMKGGKGIAATFGSLLGLIPVWTPALLMAGAFLFFSLLVRITPDYYRTLAAYAGAWLGMLLIYGVRNPLFWGFTLITGAVFFRLYFSTETVDQVKVGILWKR